MAATATTKIAGNGYTGGAGYTATSDPTVDNDLLNNFLVGDVITNTSSGVVFRCTDNTTGAAVWRSLDTIAAKLDWNVPPAGLTAFVAARPVKVINIVARPDVVGSNGSAVTATVYKAASGTAFSAGTALHTGTIDLKGTVNTNQTLALSATASDLVVAAGSAIGLVFTGTTTAAIGSVTVWMEPA